MGRYGRLRLRCAWAASLGRSLGLLLLCLLALLMLTLLLLLLALLLLTLLLLYLLAKVLELHVQHLPEFGNLPLGLVLLLGASSRAIVLFPEVRESLLVLELFFFTEKRNVAHHLWSV